MNKTGSSSQENLNLIVDNIVLSIQGGQEEVFALAETIHQELSDIEKMIHQNEDDISALEKNIRILEKEELRRREILYQVSKDFSNYGEDEIKKAYEKANQTRIDLILKKEEKKSIQKKIEEYEVEVQMKEKMILRAEKLLSRIKSVIDFLVTDLTYMGNKISTLEEQTQIGIKIIKAQEEERRRIARDIHDGPAQDIASLLIKGDILEKLMKKNTREAEVELRSMKDHLRKVLKNIRSIMYDLRPTVIDDLGLSAAVSDMANAFSEENKIDIGINDISQYSVKSPAVGLVVYRIIQESLNNAIKHSQARHISIKIDIQKDQIEGQIVDDGCGFDMNEMKTSKKSSFGLSSMRERAHIIAGKVKVESEKGCGTKILFTIPNEEELYEK